MSYKWRWWRWYFFTIVVIPFKLISASHWAYCSFFASTFEMMGSFKSFYVMFFILQLQKKNPTAMPFDYLLVQGMNGTWIVIIYHFEIEIKFNDCNCTHENSVSLDGVMLCLLSQCNMQTVVNRKQNFTCKYTKLPFSSNIQCENQFLVRIRYYNNKKGQNVLNFEMLSHQLNSFIKPASSFRLFSCFFY